MKLPDISEETLLLPGEPAPVGFHARRPDAPWLFLCEHAGNRIPKRLNLLGLPQAEINRHIGWDIGILEVATGIAGQLKAPLFFQRYSRLVIDCNRPLESDELIPEKSENTTIPGNRGLTFIERQKRIDEVWNPYQGMIANYLEKRIPPQPIVVSLHSFTPVYDGHKRPWHIGLLYHRYPDLALALKERLLAADNSLKVGLNQPYDISDEDDYTIPVFGEKMGFPHVLIEIRQDLVGIKSTRARWVNRLTRAFRGLEKIIKKDSR